MDGAVIVTTPQQVALSDARRTVNFSQQLQVPILGIIENMSGFICPHCGKQTNIFKSGGGEKAAQEMGLDFLGKLPIEPAVMEKSDSGTPFILENDDCETAISMNKICDKIAEKIGL
jgi:Mrp family chromosome partitioning ATPase